MLSLDTANQLLAAHVCLHSFSKRVVEGRFRIDRQASEKCEESACATLKTSHRVELNLLGHPPCDSEESRQLDGLLVVRPLATTFVDANPARRGVHAGPLVWTAPESGLVVRGTLAGVTNTSAFEGEVAGAEACLAPRIIEGRLRGHVALNAHPLDGAFISATYRLLFSGPFGESGSVTGVLEGLIAVPCT